MFVRTPELLYLYTKLCESERSRWLNTGASTAIVFPEIAVM